MAGLYNIRVQTILTEDIHGFAIAGIIQVVIFI